MKVVMRSEISLISPRHSSETCLQLVGFRSMSAYIVFLLSGNRCVINHNSQNAYDFAVFSRWSKPRIRVPFGSFEASVIGLPFLSGSWVMYASKAMLAKSQSNVNRNIEYSVRNVISRRG